MPLVLASLSPIGFWIVPAAVCLGRQLTVSCAQCLHGLLKNRAVCDDAHRGKSGLNMVDTIKIFARNI